MYVSSKLSRYREFSFGKEIKSRQTNQLVVAVLSPRYVTQQQRSPKDFHIVTGKGKKIPDITGKPCSLLMRTIQFACNFQNYNWERLMFILLSLGLTQRQL